MDLSVRIDSKCYLYQYHCTNQGGGCIAIAGDGGLRQWQVSNRICHLAHVPDSFFAIRYTSLYSYTQSLTCYVYYRVDNGTASKAVVLQSPTLYDDTGFVPAGYITDHGKHFVACRNVASYLVMHWLVVPEASKELLSQLPGVKTVEVTAKYPVVEGINVMTIPILCKSIHDSGLHQWRGSG